MKIATFYLLFYVSNAIGQVADYPTTYEQTIATGANSISIEIKEQPFVDSSHRLDEKNWKIDGDGPIGVDGHEVHPKFEISSIAVIWNSKKITIPKKLYSDCYSPALKKISNPSKLSAEGIRATISSSGKSILISMTSYRWSSCPYQIHWIISENGDCDRFVIIGGS